MNGINYETSEVIETYVYRESGHSNIMICFIGLTVVVIVISYMLGKMLREKLKNKKK
ncbi:hypothetical protein PBV87_09530 [Niameybacter massiliensis]|uniref:Uncharacterized protein n=1 Tax=Holtiella tumoricola TaxID=3018743 RepID=A0AA42J0V1_9FIRM|nr:hypothetical protein [Holtiella tumoricola]MDA3731717.1 hypothetical protein [Holtiella tumoricola]